MKFTTPDRINVEFSDEEKSAFETVLAVVETLIKKMKNDKRFSLLLTENYALTLTQLEEIRDKLNFFFQEEEFYFE